ARERGFVAAVAEPSRRAVLPLRPGIEAVVPGRVIAAEVGRGIEQVHASAIVALAVGEGVACAEQHFACLPDPAVPMAADRASLLPQRLPPARVPGSGAMCVEMVKFGRW